MNRLVLLSVVALCGCSSPVPEKPVEICGNGKDDDKNGLTDCQDPDCAGQAGCPTTIVDGGYFGTCPKLLDGGTKCGTACVTQTDCLAVDYSADRPLAECVGHKCQLFNTAVQVKFVVDTIEWGGYPTTLRAMNSRFVSKLDLEGSPVTCATVQAAAPGTMAADAAQIEKNGKFNVRGFDVMPLPPNTTGGGALPNPYFNVGTGGQFLIWTELWSGPRDSVEPHLPTGKRLGFGCFESGLADVVAADDCGGADAGTCRAISVKMPAPT